MSSKHLILKIEEILKEEKLTVNEIMGKLQESPLKRGKSFTYNQIGQIMRRKQFAKVGWCHTTNRQIWTLAEE